jgi:hypothetical protein
VGFQAGEAALDVPEFLEADVGAEAGLGDVVVEQLQADAVGDDGALADGDVGKGTGVHHAGVVLGGAHQVGLMVLAHEGGHGVAHFQVAGGDRLAALVEGHGNVVEAFFRSARSRMTARMAIHSEPTAMPNLDCMVKPSYGRRGR